MQSMHRAALARNDSERVRVAAFFIIPEPAELRATASLRRAQY